MNYASRNHTIKLELDGTDNEKVANTLTDEAGLKNDEITSAFDSQIIIDKTAPTIEAAAEFNGSSISFTAKDIAPDATEAPSGVVGYQITNSNVAPTSGWINVVVPEVQTVDGKQQTSLHQQE